MPSVAIVGPNKAFSQLSFAYLWFLSWVEWAALVAQRADKTPGIPALVFVAAAKAVAVKRLLKSSREPPRAKDPANPKT
jgi:hypothetical protein